jgi:lysophospholipase L1-like esterase
VADPVLLKEIESVLDGAKFDVIQFNNGMHGWQHSEEEYRKAFPKLIKTIRAHAPKAKLIWATTTPLRNGKDVTYDTKAEYSDERIAARNALAAEVVTPQKIPMVDLNAAVRGHPELHSDNVHFNGQGVQILAAQVCAAVEKLLPR